MLYSFSDSFLFWSSDEEPFCLFSEILLVESIVLLSVFSLFFVFLFCFEIEVFHFGEESSSCVIEFLVVGTGYSFLKSGSIIPARIKQLRLITITIFSFLCLVKRERKVFGVMIIFILYILI